MSRNLTLKTGRSVLKSLDPVGVKIESNLIIEPPKMIKHLFSRSFKVSPFCKMFLFANNFRNVANFLSSSQCSRKTKMFGVILQNCYGQ